MLQSSENAKINLWISYNGGEKWEGPVKSVSGDVGKVYNPGMKKILWDVCNDFDIFIGDSVLFRVGSGTQDNNVLFDSRDGRTYKIAKIGNDFWMAENLSFETKKGSSCYLGKEEYGARFGRLYTWYVAAQVCPPGWELPSESDWEELINNSGGAKLAGINLKSKTGWQDFKIKSSDVKRFSALPGGYSRDEDTYKDFGDKGYWWSSTESRIMEQNYAINSSMYFMMESDKSKVTAGYTYKSEGLSVRCKSNPIFFGESKASDFVIIKPGCRIEKIPVEAYIKNYVEKKIISWQTRGEQEAPGDFRIRVNETARIKKIKELVVEALARYNEEVNKTINWREMELGQYSTGEESFTIKSAVLGDFELPVPINDAIAFRNNWKTLEFTYPEFFVRGDTLMLAMLTISNTRTGKHYSFENKNTPGNIASELLSSYYSIEETPPEIVLENIAVLEDKTPIKNANPTEPLPVVSKVNPAPVNQFANYKVASASTPRAANPGFGKFYALLIGVNAYNDPGIIDLDEPVNDAGRLYEILTADYTFDPENVIQLVNPKREDILISLENLSNLITPDDNLLIFYAGHGTWDEKIKTGYWLPADAKLNITSNWFRNSTLRDYVTGIESKHTLVIADACFSGAIFKSRSISVAESAANENSATRLHNLPSRKAMTSGTMTTVPDKSVFMTYLTKRLTENEFKYISSEELFSSLRIAVINNSPNIPQYGEIMNAGDEGGDFIFIRREE